MLRIFGIKLFGGVLFVIYLDIPLKNTYKMKTNGTDKKLQKIDYILKIVISILTIFTLVLSIFNFYSNKKTNSDLSKSKGNIEVVNIRIDSAIKAIQLRNNNSIKGNGNSVFNENNINK